MVQLTGVNKNVQTKAVPLSHALCNGFPTQSCKTTPISKVGVCSFLLVDKKHRNSPKDNMPLITKLGNLHEIVWVHPVWNCVRVICPPPKSGPPGPHITRDVGPGGPYYTMIWALRAQNSSDMGTFRYLGPLCIQMKSYISTRQCASQTSSIRFWKYFQSIFCFHMLPIFLSLCL